MKWTFEVSDCPVNAHFPIVATQTGDNGVKRGPYYISIDSLVDALTKNSLHENMGLHNLDKNSTPPLPYGTIRYAANDAKTVERLTMEIPKKTWEIRYGETEEIYTIGFPRIIVQYIIQHNRIAQMKVFAVLDDNKPITDDTPLFHFPYPNVYKNYGQVGEVCWGGNEKPSFNSLTELERAFIWFASSPFGEDLGVKTTLGIPNFRLLIEEIKEKPFNDDWLIEMNTTFGELITTNN